MNTTLKMETTSEKAQASSPRIASIDVFRGLTMTVMIFVNALAEVRGLPWWTYHAPARVDVMTYVDMVFPFFLFAVGLSLPLAVERRLGRNGSLPALWAHILVRSFSLVVLGLILANAEKANRELMGISGNLWALLGLLCAALVLLDYAKLERIRPYSRMLRAVGLVGVVALFAIFRRTTAGGQAGWIDPSYPEILGLIGFSYFAVAVLYIPTRRWIWAPAAWFVVLVSLCAFTTARVIVFPRHLSIFVWPFGNGALCCIIMGGIVTSSIFRAIGPAFAPRKAILAATVFGLLALAAGWALTPLGISKIRATPTWSLYSVGAAALMFVALYWVCDVKKWERWAIPVWPAGANTLTTYLLPDLWYFLFGFLGLFFWDTHFIAGWTAVVKTFVFTAMMLALSGALTKAKIRLHL